MYSIWHNILDTGLPFLSLTTMDMKDNNECCALLCGELPNYSESRYHIISRPSSSSWPAQYLLSEAAQPSNCPPLTTLQPYNVNPGCRGGYVDIFSTKLELGQELFLSFFSYTHFYYISFSNVSILKENLLLKD